MRSELWIWNPDETLDRFGVGESWILVTDLTVTDSGFIGGCLYMEDPDSGGNVFYPIRAKDGSLELAEHSLSSSSHFIGMSNKGEVATRTRGIVLPRGFEESASGLNTQDGELKNSHQNASSSTKV